MVRKTYYGCGSDLHDDYAKVMTKNANNIPLTEEEWQLEEYCSSADFCPDCKEPWD